MVLEQVPGPFVVEMPDEVVEGVPMAKCVIPGGGVVVTLDIIQSCNSRSNRSAIFIICLLMFVALTHYG